MAASTLLEPMFWWWGVAAIAVFVIWRLAMGVFDRWRISDNLAERGCVALHIAWTFMLIGGENERHYKVTYRTRDGRTITGLCKTSIATEVWWKENAPGEQHASR